MKRPGRFRLWRLVGVSKLPHSTIRTRIALVYGGVFLVLGTALLATVNVASRAGTDSEARAIASSAVVVPPGYTVNGPFIARSSVGAPTDHVSDAASKQHMYGSIAALLVMTAGAVGVGWWIAGRVPRPVHAMTAKARSERGLAADEREDVRFDRVVTGGDGPVSGGCRGGSRQGGGTASGRCRRGGGLSRARQPAAAVPAGVEPAGQRGDVQRGGRVGGHLADRRRALVVRNTGPVVSEAHLAGFFEPFRRGEGRDRMGPGSGLGLSIVRSIAVAHGGTVTAVPGPEGGGPAVTVRLPVDQPSVRASRAAIQAGSPARISR